MVTSSKVHPILPDRTHASPHPLAWLGERCRALWDELRHPEHGRFCIAEVLEQERADMMPMPAPFDGYVEREARVTSMVWGIPRRCS